MALNTVLQTTISAAMLAGDSEITLASATGVNVPTNAVPGSALYIMDPGQTKGELATIVRLVTGTTYVIRRAQRAMNHISGAYVLVATAANWFQSVDAFGAIAAALVYANPWLNVDTGLQWLFSTISNSWVPGFLNSSGNPECTTLVASAAGAIVPSGPLFHVDGTQAITGFTVPVGGGLARFTIIPDAVFTWTTAGNIAVAGTAVVNRLLTFTWDQTNSKWIPSYV